MHAASTKFVRLLSCLVTVAVVGMLLLALQIEQDGQVTTHSHHAVRNQGDRLPRILGVPPEARASHQESSHRPTAAATVTVSNSPIILFLQSYYIREKRGFLGDDMSHPFSKQKCPYQNCLVTSNRMLTSAARLIVYFGPFGKRTCCKTLLTGELVCDDDGAYAFPRNAPNAAFVYYQHEAADRTPTECLAPLESVINYTWTYRLDSDVLRTYGRIRKLDHPFVSLQTDYHAKANKNVLWYVSNCKGTSNALARFAYANELAKYIDVDIFGSCSNRSDGCSRHDTTCMQTIRKQYRFYLAFENTQCKDYITEKFFGALEAGNIPVVIGPSKTNYENVAPPQSFIYAEDYDSPEALASYLLSLARSPKALRDYHLWRLEYSVTASYPDSCKLCELATLQPSRNMNISSWWNRDTQCHEPAGI